jgi:SHS2 domain-containing protein
VSYRAIDHQADIALEIESLSLEGLFRESIEGLIKLLTGDCLCDPTEKREVRKIQASGEDDEELLAGILGETLYLAQTGKFGPKSVEILSLGSRSVEVLIHGVPGGGGNRLTREIKAVTYHNLEIQRNNGRWRVQIVFDV